MSNLDQLNLWRSSGSDEEIRHECKVLLESGVAYEDIVRVILTKISEYSETDPSCLLSISYINLSDSIVHVELQELKDKHKFVALGKRPPKFRRVESPPAIEGTFEDLRKRFAIAVDGNDPLLSERCLLGIADQANVKIVFATVLETLLEPRFLGTTSGPWWAGVRHLTIGCQVDLWQRFGDQKLLPIACYIGAQRCAKSRGRQNPSTQAAALKLEKHYAAFEGSRRDVCGDEQFDESLFRQQIGSADVDTVFSAIDEAWQTGVSIDRIALAMTMHCISRIQRGAQGDRANWDNLKRELMATNVISKIQAIDETLAIKAAFHAAWQWVRHGDDGLADTIVQSKAFPIPDASEQIGYVTDQIGHCQGVDAMSAANNFVAAGHDGEEFLRRVIQFINADSVGGGYSNGQRGIIDAWYASEGHPERNNILLALAGWAADYRNQHLNHRKRYGPIWGANLSDDGKLLAVVSAGTRVFDTTSGMELMFFRGFPWRFAFHPNSRLLACGWDGGKLEIWDLIARELVTEIDAFPDDVSGQFGDGKFWGMQFSPDGKLLAGCSRGCNEVRVWGTLDWTLRYELVGHTHNRNESVTFSDDSGTIATGGNDGTVRIWNATDGTAQLVFENHSASDGRIVAVDFHSDAERIVSAECEGEVLVWNWKTGEVLLMLDGKSDCNFAAFSPDGQTVTSEHDGVLHIWDAENGRLVEKIDAISNPSQYRFFGGVNQSRDRSTIVAACWEGIINIWDVEHRRELNSFRVSF